MRMRQDGHLQLETLLLNKLANLLKRSMRAVDQTTNPRLLIAYNVAIRVKRPSRKHFKNHSKTMIAKLAIFRAELF